MTRRTLLLVGPSLFTLAWLVLGWSHPGYSQVEDTISVLAAHRAPAAWVMSTAFVLQAVSMAVAAVVLRPLSRWTAALLLVNAVATTVVAAARIPCGASEVAWCPPSEHPTSYAVHVVAATVALSTLTLAPAAVAVRGGVPGSGLAATGLAASAVMVPLLVVFAVVDAAGWAEKAVVTVGIWWAALAAGRHGVGPSRHAEPPVTTKGPP